LRLLRQKIDKIAVKADLALCVLLLLLLLSWAGKSCLFFLELHTEVCL